MSALMKVTWLSAGHGGRVTPQAGVPRRPCPQYDPLGRFSCYCMRGRSQRLGREQLFLRAQSLWPWAIFPATSIAS